VNLIVKVVFAVLFFTAAYRSGAVAQTVGQAQTADPKACSDTQRDSSGRALSDKLSESNGVICPPDDADSGIKAPTPDAGKMPVIPPPGSPGGDQRVRPK
jgi:hypothetical protein